MTSPRLLLSSSHRRLGSVRADTGDAERAPSRERVVVPTERRRPRRACAGRAVDARARRRVRRRASSDITALSFCCSPSSPPQLRNCHGSRHLRRRANAEPRASRLCRSVARADCSICLPGDSLITLGAGLSHDRAQPSTFSILPQGSVADPPSCDATTGPWPRRGDSRVRSPSRRPAPLASSSSRSRFYSISPPSDVPMRSQCARRQPPRPTIVGPSSFLGSFGVLGGRPPSVGGTHPPLERSGLAVRSVWFAVTGVSCDDSLVMSETPRGRTPLGSGPSSSGKETPFWSIRFQNEATRPRQSELVFAWLVMRTLRLRAGGCVLAVRVAPACCPCGCGIRHPAGDCVPLAFVFRSQATTENPRLEKAA